jgi:hypothetical protein
MAYTDKHSKILKILQDYLLAYSEMGDWYDTV